MDQFVDANITNLQSLLAHLYGTNSGQTAKPSFKDLKCTKIHVTSGTYRSIDAIYAILCSHIPSYNKDRFKAEILTTKGYHFQICEVVKNITCYRVLSPNLQTSFFISDLIQFNNFSRTIKTNYPYIPQILKKYNLDDIE